MRIRIDNHTAEHKPASGDHPDRVDVWYGVEWMGQWSWVPQTGIGDRICGHRRVNADTLGKLAARLRERGV